MIRRATKEDVPTILEIFNDNVINSTAIYMYKEQTLEQRIHWFKQKQNAGEPLVVFDVDGEVAGYATYGSFRAYPAFQYTVEHSVYVHKNHYKKGIASKLMHWLIEEANVNGVKTMVGCIDKENTASIKIHEKLGFTYSGTVRNAGYKFGRWLDLVFYQLDLEGPENPLEY
ncbi:MULTISPECIES: GNAT family N-acetyltransferase [Solibacillus]|uniref:N-acetyltransferase n=1 Tax=Solibacillus merdavium TaxID=2762218 RepID=A0ABR8XS34_9BACL|nr:GNAT family N-acetyltransferase [Solibacillus merdavium]MBD8034761.1 N-acetyltransferase [Solibacillus merdavium]